MSQKTLTFKPEAYVKVFLKDSKDIIIIRNIETLSYSEKDTLKFFTNKGEWALIIKADLVSMIMLEYYTRSPTKQSGKMFFTKKSGIEPIMIDNPNMFSNPSQEDGFDFSQVWNKDIQVVLLYRKEDLLRVEFF
jgi:hypothetical protein